MNIVKCLEAAGRRCFFDGPGAHLVSKWPPLPFGFPDGSVIKGRPARAGDVADPDLIPG